MKIKYLIIVLLALSACNPVTINEHKKQQAIESNSDRFRDFVDRQVIIQLPLHYDLLLQDVEQAYKSKTEDSIFIQPQDYIIGLLPDTTHYYLLLYLSTGDDLYPSLKVFSKDGKILSDGLVCFTECAGGGCEMDSCITYVDIDSKKIVRNMRIVETDCDSLGNKVPNTTHSTTLQDQITVTKSGKMDIRKQHMKSFVSSSQ